MENFTLVAMNASDENTYSESTTQCLHSIFWETMLNSTQAERNATKIEFEKKENVYGSCFYTDSVKESVRMKFVHQKVQGRMTEYENLFEDFDPNETCLRIPTNFRDTGLGSFLVEGAVDLFVVKQ